MDQAIAARLRRWTEYHAALMLVGLSAIGLGAPVALSAVLAFGSFSVIILRCRRRWTPAGHFGLANSTTLLRFFLTALLLALPPLGVGLALAALLLDGADGWLARRFGECSPFGEIFDKEADAFLTLALCLLLYGEHRLGFWILLPGALRYGFVLLIRAVTRPPERAVSTRWSRAIGSALLGSLIFCLLPVGAWCPPIAVTATFAVLGSFAASFWSLYRPP